MGIRKPKPDEKEDAKEKSKDKKPEKKRKVIEGVRGIVRIAEIDVDGTKRIRNAILGIKGVGKSLAKSVVRASGIDPEALLGSLNEEQVHKLEDAIRNPSKYGIPYFMLNRRFDPSTGENRHLISSDLKLAVKADIDFMRKIRCYKGVRHELGLPVRGQRTRSSFRTGMIVGVTKGKQRPGAPVQAAPRTAPSAASAPAKAGEAKDTKPVAGAKPTAGPAPAAKPAPAKKEEKK